MFKYNYTEEDEMIVQEFVERTYLNHRRTGRTDEQIKENIRVGKLGEIAYARYTGIDIDKVDWSGINQGVGADFNLEEKIQVKTLNKETKWCAFYNWNFDRLVVFRENNGVIQLLCDLEKAEVKEKAKKSKYSGWYFMP